MIILHILYTPCMCLSFNMVSKQANSGPAPIRAPCFVASLYVSAAFLVFQAAACTNPFLNLWNTTPAPLWQAASILNVLVISAKCYSKRFFAIVQNNCTSTKSALEQSSCTFAQHFHPIWKPCSILKLSTCPPCPRPFLVTLSLPRLVLPSPLLVWPSLNEIRACLLWEFHLS